MVARVHDAQRAEALSPLWLMTTLTSSSIPGTRPDAGMAIAEDSNRRCPRAVRRECDCHSDYSDGLVDQPPAKQRRNEHGPPATEEYGPAAVTVRSRRREPSIVRSQAGVACCQSKKAEIGPGRHVIA
jgi:hypothetical protein